MFFAVAKLTCGNCGHVNEILPKDVLEYVPKQKINRSYPTYPL